MPRKGGVGRRHKKSKVTVTEKPTPEVEEQPENGVEEEEPEDADEPIDEIDIRAQHATDLLIENLITDFAVDVQDQRLCKYEAVAVACREAWESRISGRVVSEWERDTFEEAYEQQRYELSGIYEESGIRRVVCAASRVRSVIVRSWGVRAAKSTRSLSGRFIRTGHRSARRSSAALAIGSCKNNHVFYS